MLQALAMVGESTCRAGRAQQGDRVHDVRMRGTPSNTISLGMHGTSTVCGWTRRDPPRNENDGQAERTVPFAACLTANQVAKDACIPSRHCSSDACMHARMPAVVSVLQRPTCVQPAMIRLLRTKQSTGWCQDEMLLEQVIALLRTSVVLGGEWCLLAKKTRASARDGTCSTTCRRDRAAVCTMYNELQSFCAVLDDA